MGSQRGHVGGSYSLPPEAQSLAMMAGYAKFVAIADLSAIGADYVISTQHPKYVCVGVRNNATAATATIKVKFKEDTDTTVTINLGNGDDAGVLPEIERIVDDSCSGSVLLKLQKL